MKSTLGCVKRRGRRGQFSIHTWLGLLGLSQCSTPSGGCAWGRKPGEETTNAVCTGLWKAFEVLYLNGIFLRLSHSVCACPKHWLAGRMLTEAARSALLPRRADALGLECVTLGGVEVMFEGSGVHPMAICIFLAWTTEISN